MKKGLKNWIISFLIVACCTPSIIKAYQVNLSFDSLFPMTWYQKGLESSLFVWQTLVNVFDKSNDGALLSFDSLIAKLAFAQFCINRMHQENMPCIADDKAYFAMVLHKVENLLGMVVVTTINHDVVLCAEDMIQTMRKQLSLAQ